MGAAILHEITQSMARGAPTLPQSLVSLETLQQGGSADLKCREQTTDRELASHSQRPKVLLHGSVSRETGAEALGAG